MSNLVLKPSCWASVSGGKDSLYMLYFIINNLDKYPLDGVVHFELEIDYPFIKDVINLMESICKQFNIPFVRIKPRTSWIDLYNKYGYPDRICRWCNSQYKLDCKKQLENFLNSQGLYLVNYIGFCSDEFNRVKYKSNSDGYLLTVYPLFEYGISEDFILKWAQSNPIFNDYYLTNKRCGCMGCPMSSNSELVYLKKYYPDQFNYFMTLAKKSEENISKKLNRPYSIWGSNPKYNTDYKIQRINSLCSQITFF